MSSSKYDSLIKSLSGLNIALVDANNEYRSTYDILSDIADKWDSLSTMEQSALAETIAGTRQQAVFFSIIEQFQEASGAMDAMAGSAGTLETAYETYLDSTTAHINQFKATFEELSANTFNSKLLSNIVDLGTTFTGFINTLTKLKLIIPTIGIGLLIPKFIKMGQAAATEDLAIKKLITTIVTKGKLEESEIAVLNAMDISERKLIQSEIQRLAWSGKLSEAQYAQIYNEFQLINANNALASSNETVAFSFESVAAAIPGWGWALIAITGMIAVVGSVVSSAEEANEKLRESAEQASNNISSLEGYKEKIDEISSSTATEAEKIEELIKLKDELSDKYGIQTQEINDEAKAIENLTDKIDERINSERQLYLNQTQEKYDKAINSVSDMGSDRTFGNLWSGMERYGSFSLRSGNFSQDLKKEKEGLQISKEIRDLFDESPDGALGQFILGKNSKNELEYFDTLKNTYIALGTIIRNNSDATVDELELFEKVKKEYESLYNDLKVGTEDDLTIFIPARSKQRAEEIIATVERGNMSFEEWKAKLHELADNDFVIEALDELLASANKVGESVLPDTLEELTDILERFKGQLEQVNETISTASDYFDDLAKVIDNNREVDKFFSADEMIDMLDKYPELNDNILVTAYGYKFEAEALEELRKAKVEEQKTDIETKLKEIKASKDKAEAKFLEYQSELKGISTVAEAEAELALVEQQLNDSTFKQGGYIATQLEEKRAKLAGYIEVSKNIRKLSQDYDKSVMQYTLLGNVFDDIKDKSNDTSKALNNQKEKLKDLSDEYKKAKDNIEDLIKLTMEMIMPKGKVRYYWKRWCAHLFELLKYRKAVYTTT